MDSMNAMTRMMTSISHQEPDRVPLFLLLSMYGAKERQISIKEYFRDSVLVADTQLMMQKKYRNDCFFTFSYAPAEIEAFGGEVIFVEDGPPNSGEPFLKKLSDIASLQAPRIAESPSLLRVLDTTARIKAHSGDEVPIIGVVMSPCSLPVMQMGFEKYIKLLYEDQELFDALMLVNEEFCVNWANAQLEAGATAICYFDPLASPNIIERETYLKTGNKVAKRSISKIKGPVATHLASGITLPVIDDIIATGSPVLGISSADDIPSLKAAAKGRICLLGNLNAVEMVHWSPDKIEQTVCSLISQAGQGGGFILAENHGEIPWQVTEDILIQLGEAVRKHGQYPLKDKQA